jgi:hypothetical protein
MNTKAVADAIAGRFTGITADGAAIAVGPTAELPNTINRGPALLVYPPVGELGIGVSKLRTDTLEFAVRLLLDPLDVPSRSRALYAWYDAMRDRVEMNMDLGLAYVAWAKPIRMRAALDGQRYGEARFDVVELTVAVRFNEVVTTVQP